MMTRKKGMKLINNAFPFKVPPAPHGVCGLKLSTDLCHFIIFHDLSEDGDYRQVDE